MCNLATDPSVSDKSIMKRKIIFIGGVHGVGKTSLCTNVCDVLGIEHYSASNLIKKVKNITFPTNKHIEGIEENQDSLIIAVDRYMSCQTVCLLDGHFCLLEERGDVVPVPISTFSSLSPIAIIVLYDDPSNIFARIQSRDGEASAADAIEAFQDREIAYSKLVSES